MRHSINFEPFFQASFSKLNYIMCSDIILITNHQHLLKNIISFHCSTWQNAQMKVNIFLIIEFLLKKNLAFECATFKCQEQEQVCQWILLVPTFVKPLEKVWSEDAWELTFHSPVKTANLDKNTSEKSFSCHFVKKGSDIWSIFLKLFHNKYQKFDLNPVVPLYGKKSMLVLSWFSIFTLAPRNEPLKSILVHCGLGVRGQI